MLRTMLRPMFGLVFAVLLALTAAPACAQTGSSKTTAALTTEINTNFPDNVLGLVTPAILRQTTLDIINSFANTPTSQQQLTILNVTTDPNPVLTNTNNNTASTTGLLSIINSVSGSNSVSFIIPYNAVETNADTAAFTLSGGANGVNFLSQYTFGGAGMKGSRYGILSNLVQGATTSNAPPNNTYYIPIAGNVSASHNDGGTGLTATTANSVVQSNFISSLTGTATDFYAINAIEADIFVGSSASVFRKEGILIAQLANDATAGASDDAALVIANQTGAVGWTMGIQFGNTVNGGMASTGTLMGCQGTGTNGYQVSCGTVSHGINLVGFSFTNDAFLTSGFKLASPDNGTGFFHYENGTSAGGGASAVCMGSALVCLYWGSGAPTISATQGSLYLRTDGGADTLSYSNTNGSTGWTPNATGVGVTQTCTVDQAKTLVFTSGVLTGGTCNS